MAISKKAATQIKNTLLDHAHKYGIQTTKNTKAQQKAK